MGQIETHDAALQLGGSRDAADVKYLAREEVDTAQQEQGNFSAALRQNRLHLFRRDDVPALLCPQREQVLLRLESVKADLRLHRIEVRRKRRLVDQNLAALISWA